MKNSKKQNPTSGKSKRPKVLPWVSRRGSLAVAMRMPRLNMRKAK